MDVVVPHARSVRDLLDLLDVLIVDDEQSAGDFWREQKSVSIPRASEVRPALFRDLPAGRLDGKRLGVPRMYINEDPEMKDPIETRASVLELWCSARRTLEGLGAVVVEVDFPAVSRYEEDRPGMQSMYRRGLVPPEFLHSEMWPLVVLTWNRFLAENGDPAIRSLEDVDGSRVFPLPHGSFPDRFDDDPDMSDLIEFARGRSDTIETIPHIEHGLRGLEATRRIDFEDWLTEARLDALVFPALADVAPFDADFAADSNDQAWRNGVKYANGNLVLRHLGIPTVTVPMGSMSDIGMPAGLTFAGPAYADASLLSIAASFDDAHGGRVAPESLAARAEDRIPARPRRDAGGASAPRLELTAELGPMRANGRRSVLVAMEASGAGLFEATASVDGEEVVLEQLGEERWEGELSLPATNSYVLHSNWLPPYGPLVLATIWDGYGRAAGAFIEIRQGHVATE